LFGIFCGCSSLKKQNIITNDENLLKKIDDFLN